MTEPFDGTLVTVAVERRIASIRRHPRARPDMAVAAPMVVELTSAFRRVSDLPDLEGLVLYLGRRDFGRGTKPGQHGGIRDEGGEEEPSPRVSQDSIDQAILALRGVPVPTIAAIDSHAFGPELSLALACDIRLAGEGAELDFSSGHCGTSPDLGWTFFLPRIVPPARALEMILEEHRLTPGMALSEGMLTAVAPSADLADLARERITSVSGGRRREDLATTVMNMRST